MIDWRKLLSKHQIEFVETGPSATRDNINVSCPYCGAADQGHHLGISIIEPWRGYHCWKNNRHRGRSPSRLLAALLGISEARARAMLGQDSGIAIIDDDDLGTYVRNALNPERPEPDLISLELHRDIKPLFGKNTGQRYIFLDYLQTRGYDWSEIVQIVERYELHYAMQGPFAYRVIMPIHDQLGLATWTGRTIAPDKVPRYLTLSNKSDSWLVERGYPVARLPITDCLFQEQRLFNDPPKTLVVCEGPFDAIRVDWAHWIVMKDVAATCLFGKIITDTQVDKLATLSDFCDHKFLLLDPDARMNAFSLVDRVSAFGFKPIYLPEQWEDPGDPKLSLRTIRTFIDKEIKRA